MIDIIYIDHMQSEFEILDYIFCFFVFEYVM